MPFTQPWFDVDFGAGYDSIATVGYRLYQATGADSVARTTTGVVEIGNGAYGVPSVLVPDNAVGIEWDTGGGSPVYAIEDMEPFRDLDDVAKEAAATANAAAVIVEVDANEVKIDQAITDIGNLNDLNQADVQAAMTAQGYTVGRAALLDNLDAAISSLNNLSIADVQTALTNQGYTVVRAALLDNLDAAISSISSISIADVQTAMTNQGYTTGRAPLLDNLDAAVTAVLTAIGSLNNLDQAGVQAALTTQGYTGIRAGLLDNLDIVLSTVPGLVDTILDAAHGSGSWEGADVSALATEANATVNKDEVISEIDDNEVKIDAAITAIGLIAVMAQFIVDIEGGDWERDGVQMIFNKPGGAEVARFNLFKYDGNPATESDQEVAKRERV